MFGWTTQVLPMPLTSWEGLLCDGIVLTDVVGLRRYRGDNLFITLNYKSRKPLSDQICDGIVQLAACGALSAGDQLPSVRVLALELGINPNTVQKAYRTLEQRGVLESVPGKGSFLSRQENARDQLRATGRKALEHGIQTALEHGLSANEVREVCMDYLSQKEGEKQ